MKRLIGVLAVIAITASIALAWRGNRTVTLLDATSKPFKLILDTTQAVNDTVIYFDEVKEIELGRIYQFIIQIDSVKSQSSATGEAASDSTAFRLKVQSRHTFLSNYFWSDICSVSTGGSGVDTATTVIEKVVLAVGDTAVAPAAMIGTSLRAVGLIIDSTSNAIGTDSVKIVEVYGSVEVAVRQ